MNVLSDTFITEFLIGWLHDILICVTNWNPSTWCLLAFLYYIAVDRFNRFSRQLWGSSEQGLFH